MLPELQARIGQLYPGARVVAVQPLGADLDAPSSEETLKAVGYGRPLRVELAMPSGARRAVVLHLANADAYGHDRRADRAAELLLAHDTFGKVPRQARALDVGFLTPEGGLRSIEGCGEPYLITEWADGRRYAEDLRRLAAGAALTRDDLRRVDALVDYLVALHEKKRDDPQRYLRGLRDLVGSGEGIYGVVDGYPANTPAAPPERLARLEALCAQWRWRLRDRADRLSTIHGDFHPFNVLFDEHGKLSLLDASRGCVGDPADDVTAMAVNFVFFALGNRQAWQTLGVLWHHFLDRYALESEDKGFRETAPPYFAWRALVVCSPAFYPELAADARDRLLSLAERYLVEGRLEARWADEVLR